jgi:hypothetical protein
MEKLAIAASATIAPGGPSCVNLAVPVWLRAIPSAAVLVLAARPAGITTFKVLTTEPAGFRSVSVPLRAAPVVFWSA